MMNKIDTLADGRSVYQLPFSEAPQRLAPGQWLLSDNRPLPVMKILDEALWVVSAELPAQKNFNVVGDSVGFDHNVSALSSDNDGIFGLLCWLFRYRQQFGKAPPRVFCAFEQSLPFRPQPSKFLTPELPAHVTAAIPLLDDWGIVSRIAHPAGLPGCHDEPEAWQSVLATYPARYHFRFG